MNLTTMRNFDYINKTLTEWLDEFFPDVDEIPIDVIQSEYLGRFAAALIKGII